MFTTSQPQLQELELADSTQSKEEEKGSLAIDILIGSDFYWDIVSGIKSKFVWLLSGPAKHNSGVGTETHCNLIIELPSSVPTVHEDGEEKLVEELKKFWETEAIGITERENTERELFPEQVRYDFIARRYTVGLPWKIHRPDCNNYGLCVSRLHQLMSRLKRDKVYTTKSWRLSCPGNQDKFTRRGTLSSTPWGSTKRQGYYQIAHSA